MENSKTMIATLAAGCFWGVEELFRKLPGVIKTEVGYTGGHTDKPIYDEVKLGQTGHAEAIQLKYDPAIISFSEILKFFFTMHDPTTVNQQGNDKGSQYRSVIFYGDEEQKMLALEVIEMTNKSGFWESEIVTEVLKASGFYSAEEFHQDYLQKNPHGYTCHFVRR